jgi:hypothetical protein
MHVHESITGNINSVNAARQQLAKKGRAWVIRSCIPAGCRRVSFVGVWKTIPTRRFLYYWDSTNLEENKKHFSLDSINREETQKTFLTGMVSIWKERIQGAEV